MYFTIITVCLFNYITNCENNIKKNESPILKVIYGTGDELSFNKKRELDKVMDNNPDTCSNITDNVINLFINVFLSLSLIIYIYIL